MKPSIRIEQEIEKILQNPEKQEGKNLLSELVLKGIEKIVQGVLEKEVDVHLGRDYYERAKEAEFKGYRNGYEPSSIKTAEGKVKIKAPQVRGTDEPYRSKLLPLLRGRTESLEKMACEMYVRGLSTRDIDDLFRDNATGKTLITRSAVSELTEELWKEYEDFCKRDLNDFKVVYLFLDAVYESLRIFKTRQEGILVAWAICEDGRKILLHLALGNKESHEDWKAFLRNLISRNLQAPVMVTSDGAPGLIKAIEEVFYSSLRQRCLVHKTRNVLSKIPECDVSTVKEDLHAIYYAASLDRAKEEVERFEKKYKKSYPSAVKCMREDLEACLNFLRCPLRHRKFIRSTNLLERTFGEQKRRTKIIPRFFNEKSCLKLIYSTLILASLKWSKIPMNDLELSKIKNLQIEIGQKAREKEVKAA